MSSPSLSIVITTYNRSLFIATAALSALSQIGSNDEIIIVDDGSDDQTYSLLKPLLNKKNVHYLQHPHILGVQHARNTGINQATKAWISFLDSDDYYLPGGIKKIKTALSKIGSQNDILQFMIFTPKARFWGNYLGYIPHKPWKRYCPSVADIVLKRNVVGGMHRVVKAFVAKKNLWEKNNPGHETYHYSQLASKGAKFIYLNQMVVGISETDPLSHSRTRHRRWPSMHIQLYQKFLHQFEYIFDTYPIRKAGYYRCMADCYLAQGNRLASWYWAARSLVTYPYIFSKKLP